MSQNHSDADCLLICPSTAWYHATYCMHTGERSWVAVRKSHYRMWERQTGVLHSASSSRVFGAAPDRTQPERQESHWSMRRKEELYSAFLSLWKDVVGIDVNRFSEHSHCDFIQADFCVFRVAIKIPVFLHWTVFVLMASRLRSPIHIQCHEVDYIKENKKT